MVGGDIFLPGKKLQRGKAQHNGLEATMEMNEKDMDRICNTLPLRMSNMMY